MIKVDGIWSVAADLENDYYNLLATQELSDPKYYASGYAPDATATVNYQNFVVAYLENRYVNTGTNQSNYNTILTGTPLANLVTTYQIDTPSQIGIPNTFNGVLSTKTVTAITRANPGVVTATAHGFANDDRVFFNNVVGMTELNGRSFIVANATANSFELKGTNTSSYTAFVSGTNSASVNHSKWLHSRGMYADYLEKDALAAIDSAKANCPSQSGSAYTNCVLKVLPFTSINLTELGDWTDNASGNVITVLNNNRYSDSATSVEPIRGKVRWTSGAATGATADAVTTSRKANTSLLDLAFPSISSADAAIFTDTQNFIIGASAGAGANEGQFYVNHPTLAKGANMTDSMKAAISETNRRRQIQIDYNLEHGIVPTSIEREVMDIMEGARAPEPGKPRRGRAVADEAAAYANLEPRQVTAKLKQLEAQMYQHARDLEFEQAAKVRDEIQKLREIGLANPL